MRLFQNESKRETVHKNGFPLRLALKQRHKGTRKWSMKLILLIFPFDNLVLMNGFAVGKVMWLNLPMICF